MSYTPLDWWSLPFRGHSTPRWRIVRNALRCKKCDDVIESRHRHDFVRCQCGAVFVDGGHDHLRSGGDLEQIESLHQVEEVAREDPSSTAGSPS